MRNAEKCAECVCYKCEVLEQCCAMCSLCGGVPIKRLFDCPKNRLMKKNKNSVEFVIAGEPVGKERPRATVINGKPRIYTPRKTRMYEDFIMTCYAFHVEGENYGSAPMELVINAYFKIPDKVSKKVKADMLAGKIRPTKRPDWDNLGKIVSDALNALAYNDDCQIVDAYVHKYYAEAPRLEVSLKPVSE